MPLWVHERKLDENGIELYEMPIWAEDISGRRYNSWTVLRYYGLKRSGKKSSANYWWCQCACGLEKHVDGQSLKRGTSKGCSNCYKPRHGLTKKGVKRHPLYQAWATMRNRCSNPNHIDYKYYGARGIKVCERWNDFTAFVADVGERPYGKTLDRINVEGDYEPTNVRWATHQEQMANRRKFAPRKSKSIAALVFGK